MVLSAALNRSIILCASVVAIALGCGSEASKSAATTAASDALGPASDGSVSDAGATTTDTSADATSTIAVLPPKKPDGAIAVMTYNVMCSFCMNKDHPDYEHAWGKRIPWLRDVFVRLDPDVFGIQELQAQMTTMTGKPEIVELLGEDSGYAYFYYQATPTDEIQQDYPDALVGWKTSRFEKLDSGTFWLSDDPDLPFSTGLSGKPHFPRLVAWVKLRDKLRNRDLYLGGTHYDAGNPHQEKSSPLVMQRLGPKAKDAPLLMTGDFNADPDHLAYKLLMAGQEGVSPPFADTFVLAKNWSIVHNQPTTPKYAHEQRIDHVFAAGATFTVPWWGIDLWLYGDKQQPPSDHEGAILTYVDW